MFVRQFRQLRAVARGCNLRPLFNQFQVLGIVRGKEICFSFDFLESIPAKIVAAAFHIADGEFAIEGLGQERQIPEEELFLEVFCGGGHHDPLI